MFLAILALLCDNHILADTRMLRKDSFNLLKLDAETPNFYLLVQPADELNASIGQIASEIPTANAANSPSSRPSLAMMRL